MPDKYNISAFDWRNRGDYLFDFYGPIPPINTVIYRDGSGYNVMGIKFSYSNAGDLQGISIMLQPFASNKEK